jgi:RNA polymerase primary sigma factor
VTGSADDGYVDSIAARRRTDSSDKTLQSLKPLASDRSTEFGAYLHRLADHRVLTKVEEQQLSRRHHAGDKRAGEQLVLHNTRLVVSICRRYARLDYDFEDLIQEGIIGLHTAVRKFDPDRGIKFSTYATWWVRQALQRYMQTHGYTIRVPAHVQDTKRKIERWQRENYPATVGEACKALKIDEEKALDALDGARVTASLDEQVGGDTTSSGRHDLIEDRSVTDPQEVIQRAAATDSSALRRAMAQLDDRTRQVLEMRFGFNDDVMSRNDVGTVLGIGPAGVQRAQREGLSKLARLLADSDEEVFEALTQLDSEGTSACRRTREGES